VKSLLIVVSPHHGNTAKIADAMARVLGAEIRTPKTVRPGLLKEYDLLGFGSGIYSAMHHPSPVDLAAQLPKVTGKHAFLFSTSAIIEEKKAAADHARLRTSLQSRGYTIVGEFSCRGFNTNSFPKWFGGMNRGRPDAEDLRRAEDFARKVGQDLQT
jgi:flavodoxin